MTLPKRIFMLISLVMVAGAPTRLHAQDDEFGEDGKLNTNVGMSWTVPLKPTSKFVNYGWGVFAVGAGYNVSKRHAFVGEFMWNSLYPTNATLAPFRAALHTRDVHVHGNLYSVTLNYRYEMRGKALGTYFIGGGGLYIRHTKISKPVIAGNEIACTRDWLWWGFACSSGTVSVDQTLASSSSGTFGMNGGNWIHGQGG
jgi:hypothetical protein